MEKKHYNTAGRTRLAAYLKGSTALPPQTAEEIYTGLCATRTDVKDTLPGRSSVYRMLSALCETGEVQKFRAGDRENAYVYQYVGCDRHCDNHLHLHCLSCGSVLHLECKCSDELTEHLLATHGFCVDRGRSVLYGTCATCAGKE